MNVSKRLMALGAVATAVGLAIAATAPVLGTAPIAHVQAQQTAGGVVVLIGWVMLGVGIHSFGRESVSRTPKRH